MTVSANFEALSYFQHSVGTDYSIPLGSYAGEATQLGDSSGGVVTFTFDYPTNQIFSFEGFAAIKQTSVAGADVVASWFPQIVPGGLGFAALFGTGLALTRFVVIGREFSRRLPLSVAHPVNARVRVELEFDSNTDGVVYRTAIWGYYWDFRAVRTLTGPIRPL